MSEYDRVSRNVIAVLGPTNTGKTHLAIERMLGHDTGMIGLPLRLLAREVYDRVVQKVGVDKVALITGEEKIRPESPRFWVCTVEAMPLDVAVDFLAIDEIQLAADPDRGHVFTDRLLNARGHLETLLLGAGTMRDVIADLIPGANFISRPRLSKLSYAGEKKITRLPKRTAIVAFSAADVYAIAELVRRQLGGAAVVLGALSPRTRNAQVALYQSGDVDYLVATDAIGMGLNLNVDHVAFAAVRKFDGQNHRSLTPGELAQIAGRAGRHLNDGTFGVTGDAEPFDADMVERLENHTFDPIRTLEWRSRELDFSSLDNLRDSLRRTPNEVRLRRARMADDVMALETVSSDREVAELARSRPAIEMLWETCQIPDYRKISSQNHAELVATIYKYVMGPERHIPEDWLARQVAFSDRTDGDIDTLSNRLAHVRTWTFVANRPDWVADPQGWQAKTRQIEDQLSDALHERLTQRFVDRRTSALMKGMRDKDELTADIAEDGTIKVEDHYVGRLRGFRFTPDTQADSAIQGKATRQAAAHVVTKELGMRARRVAAAKVDAFKLTRQGRIVWREEEIARLEASDDPLKPTVVLLVDEHIAGPDREKVQERLDTWVGEIVGDRLKSLVEIAKAEDVTGLARGIAFRLTEHFGVLKRETVAEEVKTLDQNARAQLRKYGVRFGAFNIYFPLLLKPAASELRLVLWALKHAREVGLDPDALPAAPRPGLTSFPADPATPEAFYRAYGFHVCGPRIVRVDMLERLADQIRPLVAWRADPKAPANQPPKGSSGDGGFRLTPEMLSILGCSQEEMAGVLKSLGFWLDRRIAKPKPAPAPAPAPEVTAAEAIEAAADQPSADPVAASDTQAAPSSSDTEPATTAADVASTGEAQPAPALPDQTTGEDAVASTTAEAPAGEPAEATAAPRGEASPVEDLPPAVATADQPSPPEAEPTTPPEPVYEDIWRPRRRGRGEHRERGGRAEGERGPRPERDGERRQHHRGRGGNRDRGHRAPGAKEAPAAATAGDASAASAPDAAPQTTVDSGSPPRTDDRRDQGRSEHRSRGNDHGRRRDEDRNRDRGRDNRDNRGGEGRRDNRRDDDRRGNRGGGGGGGGGGRDRSLVVAQSGPAPRGKGTIDPDSPFAALSALKQAMEKQAKDQSK